MKRTVPPAPHDWNKSFSDLVDEVNRGRRSSISGDEIEWSRMFERQQIERAGLRFPRDGEVYEAEDDVDVRFLTDWRMPFTGGGIGRLMKGERVLVAVSPTDAKPIAVYADPDHDLIEERMVPADERANPVYDGFSLWLRTVDLNTKFRRVHDVAR